MEAVRYQQTRIRAQVSSAFGVQERVTKGVFGALESGLFLLHSAIRARCHSFKGTTPDDV